MNFIWILFKSIFYINIQFEAYLQTKEVQILSKQQYFCICFSLRNFKFPFLVWKEQTSLVTEDMIRPVHVFEPK